VIILDQRTIRDINLQVVASILGCVREPDMYDGLVGGRELAIVFYDIDLHVAVTLFDWF